VTLPRPQADAQVQLQSQRAGPQPTEATEPRDNPTAEAAESFAVVAWFDANGDGRIDGRSSLVGGDGTLLLPAHAVDLPRYSRTVHTADAKTPGRTREGTEPTHDAPPAQSVQARQAIDAYQRYGQSTDNAPADHAVA
jgi:hypothetical protein